ncbi:hypothetical protein CHS0354_011793, partial [Potamilus streckersoni]
MSGNILSSKLKKKIIVPYISFRLDHRWQKMHSRIFFKPAVAHVRLITLSSLLMNRMLLSIRLLFLAYHVVSISVATGAGYLDSSLRRTHLHLRFLTSSDR